MIQNLRLGDDKLQNRTLTSGDSDLPDDTQFIVPNSSMNGFSDNTAANVYVDTSNTSYGGYYTWCAATAGTCSDATSDGAVAAGSICPKGWRLPTREDLQNLNSKLGGGGGTNLDAHLLDTSGPSFVHGGHYDNSTLWGRGDRGLYWSSTAGNSGSTYVFDFSGSYVNPADYYGSRFYGFSVRCVAR